jgi:hypothetical protein
MLVDISCLLLRLAPRARLLVLGLLLLRLGAWLAKGAWLSEWILKRARLVLSIE